MSGTLVIISSPSGGGKDSVIRNLLRRFRNATRLVTTTTRPKRPGEREGVDYHFLTMEEFREKIAKNDFIEYNFYAGNYYGSERSRVERLLREYDFVFTIIDVNGKHAIDKTDLPHLSIFLLPENLDVLRERITKRGGLTAANIAERLETARQEITQSNDYDHRIVNREGHLTETINKVGLVLEKYLARTLRRRPIGVTPR